MEKYEMTKEEMLEELKQTGDEIAEKVKALSWQIERFGIDYDTKNEIEELKALEEVWHMLAERLVAFSDWDAFQKATPHI